MGAPSDLCFPCVAYNLVIATYHLEDIFDTSDLKTNERLNEAKRLLHVALEQQVKSMASWCYTMLSRPS